MHTKDLEVINKCPECGGPKPKSEWSICKNCGSTVHLKPRRVKDKKRTVVPKNKKTVRLI